MQTHTHFVATVTVYKVCPVLWRLDSILVLNEHTQDVCYCQDRITGIERTRQEAEGRGQKEQFWLGIQILTNCKRRVDARFYRNNRV